MFSPPSLTVFIFGEVAVLKLGFGRGPAGGLQFPTSLLGLFLAHRPSRSSRALNRAAPAAQSPPCRLGRPGGLGGLGMRGGSGATASQSGCRKEEPAHLRGHLALFVSCVCLCSPFPL